MILFISRLSLVGPLLIAISGVVTPLGLTQMFVPSGVESLEFSYEQDNASSFGPGTTARG
jgi:hypothetical protein